MKTNRRASILSALCLLVSTTAAWAQPPSVAAPRPGNVSLDELLDAVAAASGRSFLVDRRTPESIALVGVEAEDVDYTTLLAVLRNNDLAAVELSGHVNIVPAAGIRQYPLPLVSPDDTGIADDEWVSAVIELQGIQAPQLVPVLRPLMPQEAHFAASQSENKLIVVDRFANVRRIAALIESIR